MRVIDSFFIGNLVRLRALELCDLDVMYEWENDTRLWHFGESRMLVSKGALQSMIEKSHLSVFEVEQQRFMIETLQGERVGVIDLFHFDFYHSRIELGILIVPSFQNIGIGKEAVELLEQYVFQFLSIHQIVVNVAIDNTHSISLFERLGYIKVGHLKDWLKREDRFVDQFIYQKIKG